MIKVRYAATVGFGVKSMLIAFGCGGMYYHAGFILSQANGLNSVIADARLSNGFDLYEKHVPKYGFVDVFDINISMEQNMQLYSDILKLANVNPEYDLEGILGYISGKVTDKYFENPNKVFCSEVAISLLQGVGVPLLLGYKPNEINPPKLTKEGRRQGIFINRKRLWIANHKVVLGVV